MSQFLSSLGWSTDSFKGSVFFYPSSKQMSKTLAGAKIPSLKEKILAGAVAKPKSESAVKKVLSPKKKK